MIIEAVLQRVDQPRVALLPHLLDGNGRLVQLSVRLVGGIEQPVELGVGRDRRADLFAPEPLAERALGGVSLNIELGVVFEE